jgi:hypothetical protein
LSVLNTKPRPVLLPHGWPQQADEREAFMRVLLAAGADVERMLDPAPGASAESFVRHATRMPFLRNGRERPLIAFAAHDADVDSLLELRHRLIDAIMTLREAVWLVYVGQPIRAAFFKSAQCYGGIFDAGGGLVTWHIHYGTVGLVGGDTWLAGLNQRLEELLEPNPESGIMPVEPQFTSSSPLNHIPTTEPAPPSEPVQYEESSPYAAVAGHPGKPQPRSSYPPENRYPSSMPPNPRVRKR